MIGGLHGDFAPMVQANQLEDLSALMSKLNDRGFPAKFTELSKYGKDKSYYVPWMQATYVLAINKKAMQYLPQGADVNALTYKQLPSGAPPSRRRPTSASSGSRAARRG